ncbi:MAG: hypothetical protein ACXVEF_39970 [Polyangiales bacterium]
MKTLLAITLAALASGCASSRTADTGRPEFPRYDARTGGTATIKPIGIAQQSQPLEVAPAPPAKAYAETYDPSGWSGVSTPPSAIGGGPSEVENPDNPYEEPEEATPPNPTK